MKQNFLPHLRFPCALMPAKCRRWLTALVAMLALTRMATPVHAGGGGENMLLVVNQNSEWALRIGNAYAKMRNIPANNILYIAAPSDIGGFQPNGANWQQFVEYYEAPVLTAISARGLGQQIDYIGAVGLPNAITTPNYYSISAEMSFLTQFQNGMGADSNNYRNSELFQDPVAFMPGSYAAIHHSQKLPCYPVWTYYGTGGSTPPEGLNYAQWYMGGMIGYAGMGGMTTDQVIQTLQRTVAGDGKKPGGTIYFENNIDIRASVRSPYWPPIQSCLTSIGLPWIENYCLAYGGGFYSQYASPFSQRAVRGAVIGAEEYLAPNSSVYLPGSWADSLTSYGGKDYAGSSAPWGAGQTECDLLVMSGAGGSSGTVEEPYAEPNRFPAATLFLYSNYGATLGEAFYKSVNTPDMIQFLGDLLSQAYADIPAVSFTSGPGNGTTVSGTVTLGASASLSNPSVATGVASMKLFLDGMDSGCVLTAGTSASLTFSGAFSLDTTQLTDGIHELRVVAYNNSLAESEGCALENVVVNNNGESVAITSGTSSYNINWNQTVSIPVSASQGTGAGISGIQLQSLGRVLGTASGLSGSIVVSGTQLVYGANTLMPVAILAGGGKVVGAPVTVTRSFRRFPGFTPTPPAKQNPGFDISYYTGAAGNTMATTNFTGTANYTLHTATMSISTGALGTSINMPVVYLPTAATKGLAVKGTAKFTVTDEGEYGFFCGSGGYMAWSSYSLIVDGVQVANYDMWNGSAFVGFAYFSDDMEANVYLMPGEHTVTAELAQAQTGVLSKYMDFAFQFKRVSGENSYASGPYFYTATK